MWSSAIDGRTLHFRLVGINNQNFIMEDEETGSWWQQISGEAISGPLRGRRLSRIASDEVSFAIWTAERPDTLVLLPDPEREDRYAPADWEQRVAALPTPGVATGDEPFVPRELIVGIEIAGTSKAYALRDLVAQSPVVDEVGGEPVVLVVAPDGASVRCFSRRLEGSTLELYRGTGADTLVDSSTRSTWAFSGTASSGPFAGRSLRAVQVTKDYWFDWVAYHPDTEVYAVGAPAR